MKEILILIICLYGVYGSYFTNYEDLDLFFKFMPTKYDEFEEYNYTNCERASLFDTSFVGNNAGYIDSEIAMLFFTGTSKDDIKSVYDPKLHMYIGVETLLGGHNILNLTGLVSATCANSTFYLLDKTKNTIISTFPIPDSRELSDMNLVTPYSTDTPTIFYVMVHLPGYCVVAVSKLLFAVSRDSC